MLMTNMQNNLFTWMTIPASIFHCLLSYSPLPMLHQLTLSLVNEPSLPLLSPRLLREQMSHAATGIGVDARTLALIVASMVPAVFVERTMLPRTMTLV
jgi:hypothetical protein